MLWAAFFILLLLLILYLLFVPIDVVIDTAANEYYLKVRGLAKANIESDKEELLRIKLRTFFMNYYFYPLKKKSTSKKKKITKKAVKKRSRISGIQKALRLVRSFKVKQILVDMDTGNCITNAKWYPVFVFLNHELGTFRINYEGKNRMALHMQNRPIHIIKSFINPKKLYHGITF